MGSCNWKCTVTHGPPSHSWNDQTAGDCRNYGWFSDAKSQRGTVALYHEGIGKPEHKAETLSSLELSTNGVHRVME